MLNYTGDTGTWQPHVESFLAAAQAVFTDNGVLQQSKCEPSGDCDTDELAFKPFLSRWLAQAGALVPSTQASIAPLLQASMQGTLASCDTDNCGIRWPLLEYDGVTGVGQQMAALESCKVN